MRTPRPFFIVGTPRSGTTLLQAMFMTLPGVFFPPETHFLPIALRCERRHGPLSTPAGREAMIEQVLEVAARHELPVDAEALAAELRACPGTRGDLLDALLWHMQSRQPGCRRLGEKSPAHLVFVPELLETFPDAAAITIVRDARDVALSQEALGRSTLQAALGWRRDQRLHARYAAELPADRYACVRYEDLVREPERELRRLCAFLGETFDPAMLRPHERREAGFAAAETHKARTLEPLTASRIGRYRTEMTPAGIALVEAVAAGELVANGYALEARARLAGWILGMRQIPRLLAARRS